MRSTSCGLSLLLLLDNALQTHSFVSTATTNKIFPRYVSSPSSLRMGLLDDILKSTPRPAAPRPKVEVPPDFQIPEPKPLTITPSSDLSSLLKSSIALALRLATGAFVLGWQIDSLFYKDGNDNDNESKSESESESESEASTRTPKKYSLPLFFGLINIRDSSSVLSNGNAPRPKQNLIIYEYDASPYCKRVREIVNVLDLTVEYRPCPGARQSAFSRELLERTGRQTVPYLIDPNTNVEMFESNDIIQYLVQTYGPSDASSYDSKALWPITFEFFSIFTSTLSAIVRDMPASKRQPNARSDNEQMIPIELWGYECSPFVKPVREKLCALALPHVMVSCSRGSANRDLLLERISAGTSTGTGTTARFQVPYIVDPNTNISMFESAEICEYLDAVYTVKGGGGD